MQLNVGRVTAIYGRQYSSGNTVEIRGGKPESLVVKSGFYRIEPINSNAEVTAINASSSNIKVGDYVVYAKPANFTHNVIIARISEGVASNFIDAYPRSLPDNSLPEEGDSEPFFKVYEDTSFSLNESGFEVRKSGSAGNLGLKVGSVTRSGGSGNSLVRLHNNISSIDIASNSMHFSTSILSEKADDFSGRYNRFSVDASSLISLRSSTTTIDSDSFSVSSESGQLMVNSAVIDFVEDFTIRYKNVNVFSSNDGVYLVNPHKNDKKAFVIEVFENNSEEDEYYPNYLSRNDLFPKGNRLPKKFVIEIDTNGITINNDKGEMIFDIFLESNDDSLKVVVDNEFLTKLSDALKNKILNTSIKGFVETIFKTFLQSLTSDPYAVGAVSSTLPQVITFLNLTLKNVENGLNTDFGDSALKNYRAKHVKALNDGQS